MSTLFEFLPIGAYRTSPNGAVLRANAALVRMNGYETEAQWLEAINTDSDAWYVDPLRRKELRDMLDRDGAIINFVSEIQSPRRSGQIWVREAAHAVRDADGALLYYEGTIEDITANHLAQLALTQNEERWKLALESTGDGVWDWYVQTGVEFFSRRCKEIFAFPKTRSQTGLGQDVANCPLHMGRHKSAVSMLEFPRPFGVPPQTLQLIQ
jgi:PAS domain S-box-containing protein